VTASYPRVTRLRLGHGNDERIVGCTRVSAIGEGAVRLGEASGSASDAALGDDELWLVEHVLDTQVIDVADRRLVRVGDVVLKEPEGGTLTLAGVEIGKAAVLRRLGLRRLARRAGSELVDWQDLHLTSGRGHSLQLRTPGSRVHRLTTDELEALVARLPAHRAGEVIEALRPVEAEVPVPRSTRFRRVLFARRRAPS
jgi:hypothetical protein